MNRKPKQLTQKVYEIALNTGGSFYPETNSATLQKFAEAIVEECAIIASSDNHNPYKDFGDKIRAHFGMKDYV
jgi:hypothetical protein